MLAAAVLVAGILVGSSPRDAVIRESVDLIELNHYYDEYGRLVFDQVIFRDWSRDESRFNVRAWRMAKSPDRIPQRDWVHGGYSVMWQDDVAVRQVRSRAFMETWLQYDPELLEREYLPKEKRRELLPVRSIRTGRLTPEH